MAGYLPAQHWFGETITTIYPEQLHDYTPEDQQQLIEIKRQHEHFIDNAARHGSVYSIGSIIVLNLPHMTHGDLVRALGYNDVFLQLTKYQANYERHKGYEQKLRSILTPQQIAQAGAIRDQLLADILRNGTIYHSPR